MCGRGRVRVGWPGRKWFVSDGGLGRTAAVLLGIDDGWELEVGSSARSSIGHRLRTREAVNTTTSPAAAVAVH